MDDQSIDPQFMARVVACWRDGFGGAAGDLDRPGTTLIEDPTCGPDAWIALWPAGRRVVAEVGPEMARRLHAVLADRPAEHLLAIDEVTSCWPDRPLERQRQSLYGADARRLRPAEPGHGRRVAVLAEADRPALEALWAACSEEDRDEGDVDIGGEHEVTVGVLAGPRLLAVASMFAWRGFSDIGVLTDPAVRQQGAGRAAVAALCRHLAQHDRVTMYRHAEENLGSRGIARSLGLVPIGIAAGARPLTDVP
ncbi:MAG: GNAT family N-acetyltransferase [Egicoccus sp.]